MLGKGEDGLGILDSIAGFFYTIIKTFADSIYLAVIKDNHYTYYLNGLCMSLQITLLAVVIGLTVGLLLAIFKLRNKGALSVIANTYISVIRGTPVVVQLFIIYFIILAKSGLQPWLIASVAFGLNSGAYVAEIIRSGIQAVDRGQMEAGRSLGLSYAKTMTYVIIPQAIKNVLPALGNEFVILLKETSVSGYIGIMDLNKSADKIISITYNGIVAPLIVAYVYFIMTTTLSAGLGRFERRLHQSD